MGRGGRWRGSHDEWEGEGNEDPTQHLEKPPVGRCFIYHIEQRSWKRYDPSPDIGRPVTWDQGHPLLSHHDCVQGTPTTDQDAVIDFPRGSRGCRDFLCFAGLTTLANGIPIPVLVDSAHSDVFDTNCDRHRTSSPTFAYKRLTHAPYHPAVQRVDHGETDCVLGSQPTSGSSG